jgi:hypothetical protein
MTPMPQAPGAQTPQPNKWENFAKGIVMLAAWLAFVALLVQTAVNALAAWLGFSYVDYMTALYVMLALAGVRITWGILGALSKTQQQSPNDLPMIFGQAFAQGFVMHKMLQDMPSGFKDAGIRPS